MIRLTYDPGLVEEAVLLAERAMPEAEARRFRRERDELYAIGDPERRDAQFRSLHRAWFTRLRLHDGVQQVVAERDDIAQRLNEGRVVRAVTRREEGADLVDRLAPGDTHTRPILVIRLRPETVLEAGRLRAVLRHELLHVADMIDPAFGYERTLPASDDGPSRDNILRDRYRVLWDVTIDGRLARAGCLEAGEGAPAGGIEAGTNLTALTREARWREFSTTFAMLGDRARHVFDDWFDQVRPTHAALVAFAQGPAGSDAPGAAHAGRCPLCRFPVAALDPRPERISAGVAATIRNRYPTWQLAHGVCSQCLDLYEARHRETAHASPR